jgi:hypothetical protein
MRRAVHAEHVGRILQALDLAADEAGGWRLLCGRESGVPTIGSVATVRSNGAVRCC